MGMFDYVNYKANCVKCGEPLSDFQSKDGPCDLCEGPQALNPEDVDNFYTSCDSCGLWHEFNVKRVCRVDSIQVRTHNYEEE